jgi:hypothetical protein
MAKSGNGLRQESRIALRFIRATRTHALRGHPPANSGYYGIRIPIKPITVGQIAGLQSNKGEAQP